MRMVYALVACITFLLFCIRPLFGYYRYKNDYENLQMSAEEAGESAEKEIEALTDKVADTQARLDESERREASANKKLQAAIDEIERLKKEKATAEQLVKYRNASAAELTYLRERIYDEKQTLLAIRRDTVWGELFRLHGHVQKTLTPEQQSLVRYPQLNPHQVFYTPDGWAYHAVGWCYTLEKSAVVDTCTLDEARTHQLEPCSKCVDPRSR